MTLRPGLFVSGASAGVAQPQDTRLALAGLLSGPGVLTGGAVTGSTSGPNMKYSIAAGTFVTARGSAASDGLYQFANDGALLVDSGSPAPSSGTRWDLVWVRAKNAYGSDGFGDADSLPVAGVTVGTSGSTPTKPYASVPAGALVLAEANVGTNIANASLATITQVAAAAASRGGVLPVTGAGQYPASPRVGDYIDDASLGLLRWNGTRWQQLFGSTRQILRSGNINIPTGGSGTALTSGWTDTGGFNIGGIGYSAGTLIADQAGIYDFGYMVRWDTSPAVNFIWEMIVTKNGGAINPGRLSEQNDSAITSTVNYMSGRGKVQLAAGDAIGLIAFQSSGSTIAITEGNLDLTCIRAL